MSQIENKMDDFMPFGGEIRSKYPEDDETVQHAIIDACFAALDDIMFPIDDRGKRPSECQVFFAVQRMYGAEGERDYFLLSDADTIPDEHPFTRDGADWDENGSLILTGALPDGHATICELLAAHACAEMRQLTDKGGRLYLDHLTVDGFHLPKDGIEAMGFVYRDGDESAFLLDLWDNPEMCSRPRFAEKALDMPTEEYIMYHDGVKTEFQITEVNKDSFAYEQGARYDAKVLTNGHDCGNGRFCADLDEAHEFCQQFADSVVGLGESLDDMCEDRREVASLAQDVDADNRDQDYNNHDNSEIGE